MTTLHEQQGTYLAAHSGLAVSVAVAWVTIENGVNNNILGVEVNGVLARYPTWEAGLDAAIARLKTSSYYAGIRKAIASGNACAQRDAIVESPWSGASHYGHGAHFPPVTGCPAYGHPAASPHHEAVVTVATAIYNGTTGRWVYNGPNALKPGLQLVVRGAGYTFDGVLTYPVVSPYPGYYVPVAHVRLES